MTKTLAIILGLQISMAWIAHHTALVHADFTWPWRNLSDTQFDPVKKQRYSKNAHIFAWFVAAQISLAFALVTFTGWLSEILLFFSFMAVYSLVFDILFALSIFQKWYYLGTATVPYTAGMLSNSRSDVWYNKLFGKKAGVIKAIVLLCFVIAVDLFIKFHHHG
jgi:hypothetical protein